MYHNTPDIPDMTSIHKIVFKIFLHFITENIFLEQLKSFETMNYVTLIICD